MEGRGQKIESARPNDRQKIDDRETKQMTKDKKCKRVIRKEKIQI